MAHDYAPGAAAIAAHVVAKLGSAERQLRAQWAESSPVRHFFVDDVLPADHVRALHEATPERKLLMRRQSLRESKWVGVAIERYAPSVGETLLAFQHPDVIEAVSRITGLREVVADPSFYASGISVMDRDDFLNPHLDNSHDGDQRLYRVLNVLFYASPDWTIDRGGNLELWNAAMDTPRVIESRFNRLVVMGTDDRSWHSVQRVTSNEPRVCYSNYYFSSVSPTDHEYRQVTSFRGRPEEPVKRALLRLDRAVLNAVGSALPFLLKRNRHRR